VLRIPSRRNTSYVNCSQLKSWDVMEGGADLYSALCVAEASEPARGEEKDGLGIAMLMVCFWWGEKKANGFLLHFSNAVFTLCL